MSICQHFASNPPFYPSIHQPIYKDDSTLSFDTPFSSTGIDICLSCFNSFSNGELKHTQFHYETTNHSIYLNIKKIKKNDKLINHKNNNKLLKLEIKAETEEDYYDTLTSVFCLPCNEKIDSKINPLPEVIEAVLNATSYNRHNEVKAWEQEIKISKYANDLKQLSSKDLSNSIDKCSQCDLHENLWFCLSCGSVGCGRAQFGGVGGESHALHHFDSTGHPLAVKLGSLGTDGTQPDVYSYAENDEVIDPFLNKHLLNWGIDIKKMHKTEKSIMELNIEQNLKWQFNMSGDDGEDLKPIFGNELTGIKNLGNSCYLASVLQVLFSFKPFIERYYKPMRKDWIERNEPAVDFEIQFRKIADGLISGRYSIPDDFEGKYQSGIEPSMFKALVGRGNEEFSSMRQQDAFEFLLYLIDKIDESIKRKPIPNLDTPLPGHSNILNTPTNMFRFMTEEKLQCLDCKKVRYSTITCENISVDIPAKLSEKISENDKDLYEPIHFNQVLDIFTQQEKLEYNCPFCKIKTTAIKRIGFKTLPISLILNARRFKIIGWEPKKLEIPILDTKEVFSMEKYFSKGLQPGEEKLPDDEEEEEKFKPNESAFEMLQSMGFPNNRCIRGLYNTGNNNAEVAMNWIFEHMDDSDIDSPLILSKKSKQMESKIEQLVDMGFTSKQARKALRINKGNPEASIDWLFSNPGDEGEDDSQENPIVFGTAHKPSLYKLKATICHKGPSVHSGHYVACVRKNRDWVLFNDEKVVKAEGQNLDGLVENAYIYFFERVIV